MRHGTGQSRIALVCLLTIFKHRMIIYHSFVQSIRSLSIYRLSMHQFAAFFFGLFRIWGRRFEFSISTSSGLVLLLSLPPLSFMPFFITSHLLSFGLPIHRCPPTSMLSLLNLLQAFSPNGLTISVSLLLCSHIVFHTRPCSYFVIQSIFRLIRSASTLTSNVYTI